MSGSAGTAPGLAPFELLNLVESIFAPSPSASAPALAPASASAPALATPPPPPPAPAGKQPICRSIDGIGSHLWVGTSDGHARVYELKARASSATRSSFALSDVGSSPRSVTSVDSGRSWKGKEKEVIGVDADCLEDRVIVPQPPEGAGRPKAVERLVLVPKVGKGVVLSEGVLTVHALPSLTSLPTNTFPPIRGVSAFAIDEDYLCSSPSSPTPPSNSDAIICAIKRKSMHLFRLSETSLSAVRELPLPSGAFQAVLRGDALLLADVQQYSLVDLSAASLTPLMPISQSSDSIDGRPNSAHRPSIASLPCPTSSGEAEFLFASHTGPTALGIFVTSSGVPSRSTLTWPSNPKALAVSGEGRYVVALLSNGSLSVHDLSGQEAELVQSVQLPEGLDPRGLVAARSGVAVPGGRGAGKLHRITLPLHVHHSDDGGAPSTPPQIHPQPLSTGSADEDREFSTLAHILVLSKAAVHALVPLTLLSRAEALFHRGNYTSAAALALTAFQSGTTDPRDPAVGYILQRAALQAVHNVKFEDGAEWWFAGRGDPRVWIRYLGKEVRSGSKEGVGRRDEVEVCQGLERWVRDERSIEALVIANLVRNYSPHIQPDIESAPSTVDLKASLIRRFKTTTKAYLERWRRARQLGGGAEDPSRKIDMVVDTALAELYAESQPDALLQLLDRPNDVALAELDTALERWGRFDMLGDLQFRRGELERVLLTWSRLADGEWRDPAFDSSTALDRIVAILIGSPAATLLEFAVWLAGRSSTHALHVLSAAKASAELDAKATFEALKASNEDVAQAYAEARAWAAVAVTSTTKGKEVIDGKALVGGLVLGYVKRLKTSLAKGKAVAEGVKALVEDYITRPPPQPTFFSYLVSLTTSLPSNSPLRAALVLRLKLNLFLPFLSATESGVDFSTLRRELEGLGGSETAFALERAAVYGQLGGLERQALALLAVKLQDLRSAEGFCLREGMAVVDSEEIRDAAKAVGFAEPSLAGSTTQPRRSARKGKAELLRILADLCVGSGNASIDPVPLLARHGLYLPLLPASDGPSLLASLPDRWPLSADLETWVIRGLRRVKHLKDEGRVVKMVCAGLEGEWEVKVADARRGKAQGGVLQTEEQVNREPMEPIVDRGGAKKDEVVKEVSQEWDEAKENENTTAGLLTERVAHVRGSDEDIL